MADRSSDEQLRNVQREIRESIRRNHPNPERIGCVGPEKLRQMAEGAVAPTDPAYHHVMECSPCYEELMELTKSVAETRKASARRRMLVSSIAAVVALAAVLFYFLYPRAANNQGRQPSEIVGNSGQRDRLAVAMLNLDSEPTQRSGERSARTGELQRLPRKEINLTINLPRGMEDGAYDLEMDTDTDRPVFTLSGNAEVRNGLTVLVVRMDLSRLTPGKYLIRIRRRGESWRDSYVIVS
jgi:hypothetical protein